jgi:hypothetical protein
MKTLKNILVYFYLMFALVVYIGHEFSDSFFFSGIKHEILDTQTESESREYEERTHAEEYAHSNSPGLKRFYISKQKQYCIRSCFISFDYEPIVWTPPKGA